MTKNVKILGVALLILLMATGCGPASPSSGMNQATAHILTLYAVLTNSAPDQNTTPTNPIVLDTDTPGVPTATATLAPTATSAATDLPTVTPTPSELPTPCYRAYFVKDVTIPDYTKLAAGETFVKTWRLENNGTCDWPADTQVVFISGSQLGAPSSQSIGAAVAVGEERDIGLTMKSPAEAGTYTGYWMLKIPNAGRFGIGDAGNQSFWVIIVVSSSKSPTPSVTKTVGTPLPTKTSTVTPTTTPTPTGSPTPTPNITGTYCGAYPAPSGC
ncbi:MAG: NBR1-Ig-like domain-containing protein [Anaerolineales bacterium]